MLADAPTKAVNAWILENVTLSYDMRNLGRPEFFFFDENGALINGLFYGANPFLPRDEKLRSFDSPHVLLSDRHPKPNICHFLFDSVPRFEMCNRLESVAGFSFVPYPYADKFLDELGSTIHYSDYAQSRRGVVHFKKIYVVDNSFAIVRHPANRGLSGDLLKSVRKKMPNLVRQGRHASEKRVFLTRDNSLTRQILNQEYLMPVLLKHNFEILDAAALSISEQMTLFSGTDCLMGIHGAGLSNLFYMSEGSRIIEILPPLCATDAYYVTANMMGHRYFPIVAQDPEMTLSNDELVELKHESSFNRRDVLVDPKKLDHLLTSALSGC